MATLTLPFTGKAGYQAGLTLNYHRLLVSVRCQIGAQPAPVPALLDTASEWCVLRTDLAEALGYDPTPDPDMPPLETRFGKLPGRLVRIPVVFEAEEGDELEIDATWYIANGWPGPPVIGWKGCLERLRFALDPSQDTFYFAPT